jgi:predicted DNA-binding transcriptional regulator AlpA
MSDKLINLPDAARLVGISYTHLTSLYRRHAEGFPIPVEIKGRVGNPLFKEADFLEFKKKGFGIAMRGLDNQLVFGFLTGKIANKPLGIKPLGFTHEL